MADSLETDGPIERAAERRGPGPGSMSAREAGELIGQLASLTRSGLPLPSGLRASGAEIASGSLRSAYFALADRIEAGEGLDGAIGSADGKAPAYLRTLVLAGARSGRMADVLGESARAANIGESLRSRFRATLAYPIAILIGVIALVGFICHLSVTSMDALIGDIPSFFRGRVSSGGEAAVLLARFLDAHGGMILTALALLVATTALTFRFAVRPATRRRLACSVPVTGPMLRFSSLAEFCHLLALLIEAELPMPVALRLAGDGVADADLAESCGRMAGAVEAGHPLSEAVKLWAGIPAGLGQLFRWSEGHGQLPDSLRMAGSMFEARARSQASYAGNVLGAMLLLLILWWVGFAVAALYLPLIRAIGALSG